MTIKPIEDFVQKTIEIGYLSQWESRIADIIEKYIEDYNTSQSENTVVLKSYDDLTDLHLALIQGEGPDILNLQGLDIDEYIEKGILENMDPYFESSHTLKKEDILPSVREMISKDGSVYYLFPFFSIDVMIIGSQYADGNSLTTDEFLTMISQGDEAYLCDQNDVSVMLYLTQLDLNQYVDWEKKTCSFDDGRFASYMENLKNAKLPEKGGFDEKLTYAERIHGGKYAAIFGKSIGNTIDYRDMREAFEGFADITGYPNQQGKEIYPIQPSGGLFFGINHSSDHKDASWEFLEYYIRETAREREINRDVPYAFSILKDTFEMQLYPVADPGTNYSFTNFYTGESYKEYPIVTDKIELMTFLDGEKSAEEVADIIQSRVSLYMAE